MVKFDNSVPLPVTRESAEIQTLRQMEAGQSFVVKDDDERKRYLMAGKRKHIKIKTKKENGKGYRIWRIK